jgi:hypothetical protein
MPRTTLFMIGILIDALVATPLAVLFQPWTLAMLLPIAVGMMLALSDLDRRESRVRA